MKRRKAILTTAARADLFEDHIYISQHNLPAADRFVLDFDAKIRSFAELGLTGVNRAELGQGLRSFAYRDRSIIFVLSDEELTVLRVLHGHQDASAITFEEKEED